MSPLTKVFSFNKGFHHSSPLSEEPNTLYLLCMNSKRNCKKLIWILNFNPNYVPRAQSYTILSSIIRTQNVEKCPVHKWHFWMCTFSQITYFNCQRDYCVVRLFWLFPWCLSTMKSNSNDWVYLASLPLPTHRPQKKKGEKTNHNHTADHLGVSNLTGKGESYMTCIFWSGWWEAWGCQKGRPKCLSKSIKWKKQHLPMER